MDFEVIGDISHAETFAAGSSIREIARLRKIYGRGRWRKRKGIAEFAFPMALPGWRSYTGTKLTVLDEESSKSSATLIKNTLKWQRNSSFV